MEKYIINLATFKKRGHALSMWFEKIILGYLLTEAFAVKDVLCHDV